MKDCCTPPASEITFQTHPSERKKSRGVVACCGCSCCCCCLHSLGSLIGGIYGAIALTDDETFSDSKSTLMIYWGVIIVISLLSFLTPNGPELGLLVVLGGLPGLQLLSSILAFIILSILPKPEETYRNRTLWRMTKCAFLGTVIGCLVMGGGGIVMSNM